MSFKVCGIIVTSKLCEFNFETVNETPFIEIEPFSTIYFLNFLFKENLTIQDLSIILIFLITEVVST